jgi:small-conductance mechanosensitive channel
MSAAIEQMLSQIEQLEKELAESTDNMKSIGLKLQLTELKKKFLNFTEALNESKQVLKG